MNTEEEQEMVRLVSERSLKKLRYDEEEGLHIAWNILESFAIRGELLDKTGQYCIEALSYPSKQLIAIGCGQTLEIACDNLYRDIERTETRDRRECKRLQQRLKALSKMQDNYEPPDRG